MRRIHDGAGRELFERALSSFDAGVRFREHTLHQKFERARAEVE
jgi:hypothetical protein